MKRIYDWITKANQVLLFFVIMGGAGLVAYLVYQSSRTFEPPHVVVAQTAEEAKETYVHDVDFLGEWSGFYVLGMMKRIVTPAREPWGRPSVSYLGKGNDNGQLVNIVFSKGEQRVRTLLEKDGLVLFHNVYSNLHPQPGQERSKALFFRCVTEDTDGDHRLDEHDRNDLYIVGDGIQL